MKYIETGDRYKVRRIMYMLAGLGTNANALTRTLTTVQGLHRQSVRLAYMSSSYDRRRRRNLPGANC